MEINQLLKKYLPAGAKPNTFGKLTTFEVSPDQIIKTCTDLFQAHGLSLKIISAFDERKKTGAFKIMYVFGIPKENVFIAPFIQVQKEFPSLTPVLHEASIYERKIMTFFGLVPVGHPEARTLILHENWPADVFPLRKDFKWNERPAKANSKFEFRKINGEGVYEIPVGPVHAGIIEPGHFRFSVAGEEILMLEPRLGYSHKGTEKLFEVLPMSEKVRLAERISGDTSFSHSLAFCQAVEELGNVEVSDNSKLLRVIYSELERLANHFGDIGAIMTDTGFNFGGANGARLREMILQINERLAGSRFLRGVNCVGGVTKKISREVAEKIKDELSNIKKDFTEVLNVAEDSSSLLNRLEGTGKLDKQIGKDHGVVGIAGRALGFKIDTRIDFPYAAYDQMDLQLCTQESGDVFARFYVRVNEAYNSFDILKQALSRLEDNTSNDSKNASLKPNSYVIGMVEGWRGEIVHLASTDANGNIDRVDVRDPSFLNWTALGHAGPGNMVPDFPLINKSFNLSYSGNDL